MSASSYLARILAAHRTSAEQDRRPLEGLVAQASQREPARSFRQALLSGQPEGLGVIAELKRRSPSKGDLAAGLDPAQVAREYEAGGARCLSVLTDSEFFGGSPADLVTARDACALPVLRKDFTVSQADVCDARIMGADCVLLIVAALDDRELSDLLALSREIRIDALVEVHDQAELDRALAVGADLVGVNQRDLTSFAVDTDRALAMVERIPDDVVAVAESGISGASDAKILAEAGYQAVLVGEAVVTAPDRSEAVRALSGHRISGRRSRVPGAQAAGAAHSGAA